ncbi:MAG: hypothetical protein JOZ61_07750 [Verrucomicrobia bacterium]|nr:hypothetical protein [Verrucomicrobiota bacterium]
MTKKILVLITLLPSVGVAPIHASSAAGTFSAALTRIDMAPGHWRTDSVNEVAEVNETPQISSTPITTGQVGAAYRYQVVANDADGHPLKYWVIGPKDMIISVAGLITWAPVSAGFFRIVVNVTDGRGGKASQSYSLTVTGAGG